MPTTPKATTKQTLPAGKDCAQCVHFDFCRFAYQKSGADRVCIYGPNDYGPSRFEEKRDPVGYVSERSRAEGKRKKRYIPKRKPLDNWRRRAMRHGI